MIRAVWFIPFAALAVGAGLLLRARHRRQLPAQYSLDHVSGDWLAHARGHEEQEW